MPILIYAGFITGVILIFWALVFRRTVSLSPKIRKDIIEENVWQEKEKSRKPFILIRPFLSFNRQMLIRLGQENRIKDALSFVNINLLPEEFLAIMYLVVFAAAIALVVIMKKVDTLWLTVIVVLGFVIPRLYLSNLIKKRKRQILKALPDLIDLLTLCVEAGLDFMNGLNWVLKRFPLGALTKEVTIVVHEIKMGKSRHEALKDMSRRVDIPDMSSFVNTLCHTERLGTPIIDVLRTLSVEARRRRFQRGERLALQAPIKMLFPLIFFILPVVAIIVGGPVILNFVKGGLPKF